MDSSNVQETVLSLDTDNDGTVDTEVTLKRARVQGGALNTSTMSTTRTTDQLMQMLPHAAPVVNVDRDAVLAHGQRNNAVSQSLLPARRARSGFRPRKPGTWGGMVDEVTNFQSSDQYRQWADSQVETLYNIDPIAIVSLAQSNDDGSNDWSGPLRAVYRFLKKSLQANQKPLDIELYKALPKQLKDAMKSVQNPATYKSRGDMSLRKSLRRRGQVLHKPYQTILGRDEQLARKLKTQTLSFLQFYGSPFTAVDSLPRMPRIPDDKMTPSEFVHGGGSFELYPLENGTFFLGLNTHTNHEPLVCAYGS